MYTWIDIVNLAVNFESVQCFGQKPDGLIFPDRATLYICAIEDRQYKDEKINCKYIIKLLNYIFLIIAFLLCSFCGTTNKSAINVIEATE